MKKTISFLALLSLILGILGTSCVSSKKFKSSQSRIVELQRDSLVAQNQIKACTLIVDSLKSEKTILQIDNNTLQSDNKTLQVENNLVQNDFDELSTTSERTIAGQEEQLKNLNKLILAQKDVMNKLKNSISEALMNYNNDELNVYTKDGKVYVSLEEKLLFPSGSDLLDAKGKDALKALVKVLVNTKDITVMVEGHTDDVPIKTAKFEDNWDLSTSRATAILRIMTTEYGFDSNLITASGKGKFHPVKSNATPEGKAANRRTEIILTPDLKELYNLMN
jgi:chemotaxis protein MotB